MPERMPAWASSTSCVVVSCTECGSVAANDSGTIHFPDFDTAIDAVTYCMDWEYDQAETLICAGCIAIRTCATKGHNLRQDDSFITRWCSRCGEQVINSAPNPGSGGLRGDPS